MAVGGGVGGVANGVLASNTTGSPTITTSGGYRYYTFTASGSITF